MKMNRFLVSLFVMASGSLSSFAQVAGPNNPGSATVSGNGVYFVSYATGFNALDNNMAYAVLGAYPNCTSQNDYQCFYSELASISNYGFSIPTNAVVNGIMVEISKRVNSPVSDIRDSIVQLMNGGVPAGSNYASPAQWPMPFTYVTYGGLTDLWNTTWTPADINAANFGVQLQITNGAYDQTAQVDHVRVTVYYTTPAGLSEISGVSFQPFVAYPNIEFRDLTNITDGKLVILDRLGRQVVKVENFSGKPIDISALKKGMYVIRLETTKGTVTRKINF